MFLPRRTGRGTPHRVRVESARVAHRVRDGLRHAERGGGEHARQRRGEREESRVAGREEHRGGAAHRESDDAAGLRGAPVALEDRGQFLREERLPLVVLTVVLGHPVGVEAGLAADREDDVDVLVGEERFGVGLERPAVLVVLRAESVEHVDGRELLGGLRVPVARKQHLHLDRHAHRRGVDPDRHATVGEPVDVMDRRAARGLCGHRSVRGGGRSRDGGGLGEPDRHRHHEHSGKRGQRPPSNISGRRTLTFCLEQAYSHDVHSLSARRGQHGARPRVPVLSTRKRQTSGSAALLQLVQLLLPSYPIVLPRSPARSWICCCQ